MHTASILILFELIWECDKSAFLKSDISYKYNFNGYKAAFSDSNKE